MSIHISVLSDFNQLTEPMLSFLDEAEKKSIFFGKTWYQNYTEHVIEQDKRLVIYVAKENDSNKIIIIFPLVYDIAHGSELQSLSNYYTSLFAPVVDTLSPSWQSGMDLIVKHMKNYKTSWNTLNFRPLDENDEVIAYLFKALKRHNFMVQKYFAFGNWVYHLDNKSFDEYFNERPSRLKNTIKRKTRKLSKEFQYSIKIYTKSDQIDKSLIDEYERIYKLSWKQDEPYPEFVRGILNKYAYTGQLRFGFLFINDKAVASQIWFVTGDTASIYKLAYDPEYKQFSVGSILTKDLMQYVIEEDKVKCIDYLTGDDAYKRDWMSERNIRIGIIAFNSKTLKGFTKGVYNIWGRKLKHITSKLRS